MKSNKAEKLTDLESYDYLLLHKDNWKTYAEDLIELGYKWSGHTKIEPNLELNSGLKSTYYDGVEHFLIHLYDKEHKLICIRDVNDVDERTIDMPELKDLVHKKGWFN